MVYLLSRAKTRDALLSTPNCIAASTLYHHTDSADDFGIGIGVHFTEGTPVVTSRQKLNVYRPGRQKIEPYWKRCSVV